LKGVIFTELLDFIEARAGLVELEQLIAQSQLASGGAYTAVGDYPHEEAVRIVVAASEHLEIEPGELMRQFGHEIFQAFVKGYPQFFHGIHHAKTFLRGIETHIHNEVRKLYPESDPPSFGVSEDGESLMLAYTSRRPMAMIALGLIEAAIIHFDDPLVVVREAEATPSERSARFRITPG
jgi:hypothetical protein